MKIHIKEPKININEKGKYFIKYRIFNVYKTNGDWYEELKTDEKYCQEINIDDAEFPECPKFEKIEVKK